MLLYLSINLPSPTGEWDDYSLPAVSIITDQNIDITENDIMHFKTIFPEWSQYIDYYSLSGYVTKSGGEMPWYFPTYSVACIPFIFILSFLDLPAIYAFAFTNLACLMAMLLTVYWGLQINDKKKLILIGALSINPIIFYLGWISAEAFIYAMLGIAMVCWYNHWYKRAALFVSIAGMLNPVIMIYGIVMIVEYFIFLFKIYGPYKNIKDFIYKNIKRLIRYGTCYIVSLIPLVYNYYNTGHINLTASYSNFTKNTESILLRFKAYLLDLNFGYLPYYSILLIISVILIFVAIQRRHIKYLEWMFTFLATIYLYSIMTHINSAASGIARYNSWGASILIFCVILFFDEILYSSVCIKAVSLLTVMGILLTGSIVFAYGPFNASKVPYTDMTPIARCILDNVPDIYNPLHSTFNSRVNHIDGGYNYHTPIIYTDVNGYIRKILAQDKDKKYLTDICKILSGDISWFNKEVNKLNENAHYISVPKTIEIVKCQDYPIGEDIWFYTDAYNADEYVISGLSAKEEQWSWTDGTTLRMRMDIIGTDKKVLHGYIKSGVFNGSQRTRIYVNGSLVLEDTVTGDINFNFENPDGIAEILIEIPDAVSPLELGQSRDNRKLGLCIQKMKIVD